MVAENGNKTSGVYKSDATITYTIKVENYGNVAINNLVVTDTMSKELQDVLVTGAVFKVDGINTTDNKNPITIKKNSDNQVTLDTLAAGDSVSFTFVATVKSQKDLSKLDGKQLTKLNNNVKITGDYGDGTPVPEDEDDSDDDEVDVFHEDIPGTSTLDEKTPTVKTGDATPIALYMTIALLALAAIGFTLYRRKKKQ